MKYIKNFEKFINELKNNENIEKEENFNETIEFLENEEMIDEGIFKDIIDKIFAFFRKIGDYFIAMKDKIRAYLAVPSINIFIARQKNRLPVSITYLPNKKEVKFLQKSGYNPGNTIVEIVEKRRKTIDSIYISVKNKKSLKEDNELLNEEMIQLEHFDKNVPNIDTKMLKNILVSYIRGQAAGKKTPPILIWGAPGIGKTAIVNEVAKIALGEDVGFIDVTLGTMNYDDFFIPAYEKDEMGNIVNAKDVPKTWLPVYKETGNPEEDKKADEIVNGPNGGVLFLDELTRANPALQNACLKLLEERRLGDYVLGSKWAIVAASNRSEDDPDFVIGLSRAAMGRFTQYNFVPDFQAWKEWARKRDYFSPEIIEFLEFNKKYWYYNDPEESPSIFASPRSWDKAAQALSLFGMALEKEGVDILNVDSDIIKSVVASAVGNKIAHEFVAYVELKKKINIDEIDLVFTKPEKAPLPENVQGEYKLDSLYATLSMVIYKLKSRLEERNEKNPSKEEFKNFAKYLVRLKNESAAVWALKFFIDVFPDVAQKLGDEKMKHYEKDWDYYIEGTEILVKGYPSLSKEWF